MEETFMIDTDDFQLTQMDFFIRLLIATGIGLLIGLEREHASPEKEEVFAGVRTFVFVVLFGFLIAFLSFLFTHWLIVAGLISVMVYGGLSYWVKSRDGKIGGTTAFATLTAFILGSTTFLGFIEASLAVTVIALVMLSLKEPLHSIVRQITQIELFALVKFVVISLLVLPVLPDETMGPYDVLNPQEVGWVIILTSGIGFLGYILMKFLGGKKGILLTGIFGGLVSSTVVAWVFAEKSKEIKALSKNCAVAILTASSIMVIRVFVWMTIFNQELIGKLALPLALVFLAGVGAAFYYYKKPSKDPDINADLPLGEPLNLKKALFFGLLYSGILLLVSYANSQLGTKGVYISSGIAALTDINAITISVSKLAGNSFSILTAQNVILIATLCNTLVKIGISISVGSKSLRNYILLGFGLVFLMGIAGFLIINF
ncbi:MgtC/SapB family protein [Echinicola jeungdonensis]|uniref:MgtC/SapB family protein n=1 Tax=Echinicola jeungdonensis TaxID=709343 RepID=A0ABV5J8D0_9BACT|nr:MgtC/SapB family protein [Echinicola jeungdonensis]MDN3669478.1 MgtC/SapB family protein [Echinicola jeungdonensis]